MRNLSEIITNGVANKLDSAFNPMLERSSTDPSASHRDNRIVRKYMKTFLIVFGFIILIAIVFGLVSLILTFHETKQKENLKRDENENIADFYKNRSVWEADNGRVGSKINGKSIKRVILMQSTSPPCGSDFCRLVLLRRQHESFNAGHDDILENFIVGTDGNVYEGRGFERQGDMSKDKYGTTFSKDSMHINILCDRTLGQIKNIQIKSLQMFLKKCVEHGKLVKDYKLFLNYQIVGDEFDEKLDKIRSFKSFVEGKKVLK